jgi:hypothetical protein
MGHHYVPQHHLRNFQDVHQAGLIWMFDKDSGQSCLASITKVAQEAGFYEPEIEVSLNEMVEKPANPVMDRLLRREVITPEEKSSLALYIAVMLKRVPYRRQQASTLVPQVLDDTVIEIRDWLRSLIRHAEIDQVVVHERLTQVDAIYDKYKREPPPEVIRQIRAPWPTAEMVELVKGMTWRVMESSGPNFFMTCDNPAFFFSAYGLKNPEAEVCFPLSTRFALHCCWQKADADIVFLDAPQSIVREVNRRLASTTLRFAFYHERVEWVHEILSKESPYLSRIVW